MGIATARNFITTFFPENTPIFCLDDNVKDLAQLADGSLRSLENLSAFIDAGFQEAMKKSVRLLGIYPISNAHFMRDTPTTYLMYIVGCAFGIINPGPVLQCTLDDKEDFQRSLHMYLLDGGVLRLNNVAPITNYWTTPGGNQVSRTKERAEQAARAFVDAYKGLAKLQKRAHGDDVRLWDSRTNKVFGPAALAAYEPPRL